MSVNPAAVNAAAAAAGSTNAAVEALIAAEITALAADAQALQSQVTTGQVVTAQVLPSNGLTDLIEILGNRVAAALPPGLAPGDVFSAQVTGFNGPQILLQVLNTQPAPSGSAVPPGLETPATVLLVNETPPTALELAATRPLLPDGVSPSIAPPPAVFVAASVRPAAPGEGAPAATATTPVNLSPPPPSQVLAQPIGALADIEMRLAAARAGSVGVEIPNAAPSPPPAAPAPNLPPAPNQPAQAGAAAAGPPPALSAANFNVANASPLLSRFSFPPPITQSTRFADPTAGEAPAPTGTTPPPSPAPAGLAAFRDPAALVRALSLPVTPSNVAAAKMALDTPQRLPSALATLENALPNVNDPRVATLRTLSAFVGRLEPSSPQLAAQISAYVDNIVTGNESKLVQLLTAQQAALGTPAPPPPAASTAAPPAGGTAGQPAPAPPPIVPEPAVAVLALAQAAERGAALSVDLKTQLLAVINAPPAGTEDNGDLIPAASSALSAITAVQINAAQAMNAAPQQMTFTLPMWLGSGYAQANIAIDRDAPEPGGKRNLDGDNFHIAFILDTQYLGTVTVDLQTVGRSFSLAVKTENESSAKRFAESLTTLTGRLEKLRYRVNSAEAVVAARGAQPATPPPGPAAADELQDDTGTGTDINVRA